MPTFTTNPIDLRDLLRACHEGTLQLPDFQRGWVWDEDRIKGLIASVSRAFPVGALMTLQSGGPVNFKPRPIEGAPGLKAPTELLLDGQQRMTSLYQVTLGGNVVETLTAKNRKVRRWFYIDIRKALDATVDREEAIVGVPEEKIERSPFGRDVVRDLSTPENEYAQLMYPMNHVFDWDKWQDGYDRHWRDDEETRETFRTFKRQVLENFMMYRVPVISLDRETTREAVCTVFEKVNTGGKPLDAFELVTAIYAAENHQLRKDWYGDGQQPGRYQRLLDRLRPSDSKGGILLGVRPTDFLHGVSLFHTREVRREAEQAGRQGKELPAVSGNREAILNLPLKGYLDYQEQVEEGFVRAADFLHTLHIYRMYDLPYQSQIVPLAAILADLGDGLDHVAKREKLERWYWCGVFGELYGSTVETRIAKDFMEVPAWLSGGPEPSTVRDAVFRAERLRTMRMRLSAAYKGVHALLMKEGALDFRSGQKFDHAVYFGENVDIHHIFPKAWCEKEGKPKADYDSIINKTPLSFRSNRIIGGGAPSDYLAKLERGGDRDAPIAPKALNKHLATHLIDPALLRGDSFEAFMAHRQARLLELIEGAMGKQAFAGPVVDDGDEGEDELDAEEDAGPPRRMAAA